MCSKNVTQIPVGLLQAVLHTIVNVENCLRHHIVLNHIIFSTHSCVCFLPAGLKHSNNSVLMLKSIQIIKYLLSGDQRAYFIQMSQTQKTKKLHHAEIKQHKYHR